MELPKERGRGVLGMVVLATLFLVPVAYLLSAGPALWLCVNAGVPAEIWNTVYWPLTFLRDLSPQFHQLFQWYLDLWTG